MMKMIIPMSVCLFWSIPAYADSLTVIFTSGMTQRVELEGPGDAVQSIVIEARQQDSEPSSENPPERVVYQKTVRDGTAGLSTGETNVPPVKNRGPRIKWGTPKTGE